MPRPRLSEEEITAMRERILGAAVDILHEEGPGGLSIRAITERIGVSHMVFYSYFENRDELFGSLREHQRRQIQARHSDTLARARGGDVGAVVREVLEGYVTFAHNNPRIFRFLWCALPAQPAASHGDCVPPTPHHGFEEEMNHFARLIELGMERGVFVERDARVAALVVAGMINGPLVLYLLPGLVDEETLKQLETETVQAGLSYLTGQAC